MTRQIHRIPYGKSALEFSLFPEMRVTVAESRVVDPIADPAGAIREALAHPIGSPSLREIGKSSDRVCIVFTDSTRSSPDHLFIPALLVQLEEAGVKDKNITLLCGTGMHRPSTMEEKVEKLGTDVVARYQVIDNEPQNPAVLVNLGFTSGQIPILIHRVAAEANLLIATGVVEPHQYAGYSGGSKTLSVGAAGEASIAYTHGPVFIDDPGTRLGIVDGNPFHEAVVEVARRVGLRFILNAVLDDNKRILKVAAGDPELAFQDLVVFARSIYEVPVASQFDIVIGGVGFPKDSNLYQASRAPSYLFFAPIPVVRPGGYFIIPARCEDGAGEGIGEQRFMAAMRDAPNFQSILDDARCNGYPPGQQRAFVIAKVLEKARIIIVGSECPDLVEQCKMIPAPSIEQALDLVVREKGKYCDVLIVPHALLTLPVIQSQCNERTPGNDLRNY